MTAPSRGRDDATIRGAVVLVVAIAIGLALLWRSGSGGDDLTPPGEAAESTPSVFDGATDSSGNTVAPISGSEPEADDTLPRHQVAVVVFNGTPAGIAGLATEFSEKAAAAGFETLPEDNAAADTETTTVYFAEGAEPHAEALNQELGLDGLVMAKPAESLGPGDDMADVVVVLGGDAPGGGG